MDIIAYWTNFLENCNLPDVSSDSIYLEAFHFDNHKDIADSLLALVLEGKKKATASSIHNYKDSPMPKVGDFSIITDFDGDPKCVIKTVAVTIIPYGDITEEIALREVEDENLESWRKGHDRFFKEDGAALGYSFDYNMPVVFEDFEVVWR